MDTRQIGELQVSVVGLGCNQLGTKACDESTGERIVREALDAGITFFDTADEYGRDYGDPANDDGWGRSEVVLGRVLSGHRDDAIIASKFGPFSSSGNPAHGDLAGEARSEAGLRGLTIAVEESLRRLGTDYIDLYQLHFFDPRFPIEETLGGLDELVRAGKVREIGTSNFSGSQLRDSHETAKSRSLRPFASMQGQLSVLRRGALDDVMPVCEELAVAFIPYYPLASGVLTGKYRKGMPPPVGARLTDQVNEDTRAKILSERTFGRVEALEAYAQDRGRSLLELAFAWLLGLPSVATVIAGASKLGQASANSSAGDWRLTPQQVDEVTQLAAAAG
jgi:aryl-alcohol dehydrogenase-like predicted oxidoreductase